MNLPNADRLTVEPEKIFNYLLNATHRFGASKARFFGRFGFTLEEWQKLAEALLVHGQTQEIKRIHRTDFGPRFEVEGILQTPDGRCPLVRSIWQQDHGTVAPRLITAYPTEES